MNLRAEIGPAGAAAAGAAAGAAEALTWRYRFADLPLASLGRAAWARGFLRTGLAPALMWAGVLLACLGLAQGVERILGPKGVGSAFFLMAGAVIGAAALFAGFLGRWWAMRRGMIRREAASGYRQGLHAVTLGPTGIRLLAAHADCRYGWEAVDSVVQARAGMLLMLGTETWIALPDSGLPPGLSREAALDRIHRWMEGRGGA